MSNVTIYACRRPFRTHAQDRPEEVYQDKDAFQLVQNSRILESAVLPTTTCREDYQEQARQIAQRLNKKGAKTFSIRNGLEYDPFNGEPRKIIEVRDQRVAVKPVPKDNLIAFRTGLLNFLRGV